MRYAMIRRRTSPTILTATLLAILLFAPPVEAGLLKMEAGSVTLPATVSGQTSFYYVAFEQDYGGVAPLVFVTPATEDSRPTDIRIRNVTPQGFELSQVAPASSFPASTDGARDATAVHFFAIQPGISSSQTGVIFEVGSIDTTTTIRHSPPFGSAGGWDTVSLLGGFGGAQIVLAQIQTMANEAGAVPGDRSTPWLTAAARNITANSVQLSLERAEVNDGSAVASPETLGYVAINSGAKEILSDEGYRVRLDPFVSSDSIRGWDDTGGVGNQVNFSSAFPAPPLVVANHAKRDGVDGGWIRRVNTTAGSVWLTVDEDLYNDNERGHTDEAASVLAIQQPFRFTAGLPAAALRYAARADTTANTTWEDFDGVAGMDWSIGSDTRVDVNLGLTPGVTQSYVFPDAQGTTSSLESLGGNPTDNDASFEFWFQPNNLAGTEQEVIFETGGNVDGTAFGLEGDTLLFLAQDSASVQLLASASLPGNGLSRYHHAVGVIDFEGGGEGTVSLYLNGRLASSASVGSGFSDWAGSDGSGIGRMNTNIAGASNIFSSAATFDGQIAYFNFYEFALTSEDVLDLYRVRAIPEPATLTLLAASLALLRRRRR